MDRNLVIDADGHVMGKLGAFIVKKAREGWNVVVLNSEKLLMTGTKERHVAIYKSYLNKRNITNPRRGAFHYKEPSKYFWKTYRNMANRRLAVGRAAMDRIKVYEGIPKEFENVPRSKVPSALLEVTCNPDVEYVTLGSIMSYFGWKHANLAESLTSGLLKREREFNEKLEKENIKINELKSDKNILIEVENRLNQLYK